MLTATTTIVRVEPENIPGVLIQADRWCVWKAVKNNAGKLTKKPMQASWPSVGLSKTTASQWRPYATALQAYQSTPGLGGLGFICGGGFVGVDFDECCDEVTRELTPEVAAHVERLNTYCEYSPSGRGVRAFLLGELPGKNVTSKAAGFELYGEGAYVTVTGFRVPGTPATVAEDAGVLGELCGQAEEAVAEFKERRHGERKAKGSKSAEVAATGLPEKAVQGAGQGKIASAGGSLSDSSLLEVAKGSAKGDAIRSLLEGEWNGYPSQSEAELAMANHLAFFAGSGGEAQVERLMRGSKLARDKFDNSLGEGRTYLSHTVATAFQARTDFYSGAAPAKKKRKEREVSLPNGIASTGPAALKDDSTLTDVGLARRLVLEASGKLRYVREWKAWLAWNGKHWEHDDGLAAAHTAKKVSDKLWRELADLPHNERQKALSFVKSSASARGVEAAVRLARSEPQALVRADSLNRHPYLLNVANGTLDLATAELRNHSPGDLMTHMANVAFDATAEAPTWRKFMSEVTNGNQELEAFLKRSCGLALSADVSEQVLWLHYGEGRNGKSTMLTVLLELLGSYAGPAPLEMLLVRRGFSKEVETQFASLAGKRLVTTVEADNGVRFSEATVKLLTGGDIVLARRLYEDAWPVRPSWKLHVAANHKPQVRGTDEGIWRRLMLTPWLRRFEGAAEDKKLKEKLLAELPGILNWCVAGFLQWKDLGGLKPPECVLAATKDYRGENDILGTWAGECCLKEANAVAEAAQLYRSYKEWSEDRGEFVMTATAFGRELERLGFQGERPSSGRWRNRTIRRGLGLLDERNE